MAGSRVSQETDHFILVCENIAEMRGESRAAHEALGERLTHIEANIDGAIAIGRQHNTAIAQMQGVCDQRHKRDSDEVKKVEAVGCKLDAVAGALDKRLASLEVNGVAKQNLWKQIGAAASIAIAAAGLAIGVSRAFHEKSVQANTQNGQQMLPAAKNGK